MTAHASFYVSWPWLAGLERAGLARGRLISTRDGAAAVPVYEYAGAPPNGRYDLARFAAPTGTDPALWHPQFLVGAIGGYGNGLLVDPGCRGAERDAALGELARSIDRATAGYSAAISYAEAAEAAALHSCLPAWQPVFGDVEVVIPVHPDGFEAWVNTLPSSRRSVVRRDLAHDHGAVVTSDVRHAPAQTVSLILQVQRRHGEYATDQTLAWFLARCAWIADLGVPAPLFASYGEHGVLLAVSLAFVWGDTLYLRAVGLDYARIAGGSDYFQVLIYEPLRFAVRHGLRRVHLGIGGLRTKLLRGGTAKPLWTLLRLPTGVAAARLAETSDAALASLRTDLGRLLGPTDEPEWRLADHGRGRDMN
jgi:hypothetical protein